MNGGTVQLRAEQTTHQTTGKEGKKGSPRKVLRNLAFPVKVVSEPMV